MIRQTLILIVFFCCLTSLWGETLYKTMLVRAAPGKLLDLIELYRGHMTFYDAAGDARPLIMRHSQGDQWDLLFLFPMGSFTDYHSAERSKKRVEAMRSAGTTQAAFSKKFYQHVAWHEEVFVDGPPLEEVKKAFAESAFFHVEMFHALPGKHEQLQRQREMENDYLRRLERPTNFIFTHSQGASWDLFTIGCYRDLKHYAESADIPEEKENKAAREAGFESASAIGPYLRTLIASHHDTLAVAVP